MKKSTGIIMALIGLFIGTIVGICVSPVKNGVVLNNESHNTYLPENDET